MCHGLHCADSGIASGDRKGFAEQGRGDELVVHDVASCRLAKGMLRRSAINADFSQIDMHVSAFAANG